MKDLASSSHLHDVLVLRLLVGYLGEKGQHDWWPTAFLDESSSMFLEPAFPRTLGLSQYHGVLEAARLVHDEHLNVGCYHLFRLPEETEQGLHRMMMDDEVEYLADAKIGNIDDARTVLLRMADGAGIRGAGPTLLSSPSENGWKPTISKIAQLYYGAFSDDTRCYPYWQV